MTTAKQRKLWAEVHKALADYIINYGAIEVEEADGTKHNLDYNLYYLKCGKIIHTKA